MSELLPSSRVEEPAPQLASLLDRLEDPKVASGLENLLDHVDLLAILVIALDGFVSRSEVIGEAMVDGVTEVRGLVDASEIAGPADLAGLAATAVALSSALPKLTPSITRVADEDLIGSVLDSGIVSADSLAHIGLLATAVNQGAADAAVDPIEVKGAFSVYRQLKDPDIARGLGYTLSILKAVGRQVATGSTEGQ